VKDLAKGSWTEPTVTRNNHSRIWTLAAQDHVAAFLPPKYEPNFFKDFPKVIAGEIGRELHLPRAGQKFNVLEAVFFWDRVACSQTIFDIELNGFCNVGHRFLFCVALGNTAREHRH
jgi:hypothetical protein